MGWRVGRLHAQDPPRLGLSSYWASDRFIDAGSTWVVGIPKDITPGNYILHHEQIALHEGTQAGSMQFCPQYINLEITCSSSNNLAGIASIKLYSTEDPNVKYNIYNNKISSSYPNI